MPLGQSTRGLFNLTLRIRVCSITRLLVNPAQNHFYGLYEIRFETLAGHLVEFLDILTFSVNICTMTLHWWSPDATRNGIISRAVWRCNIQLLDCSAFRNWRSILIAWMYCNKRKDVFERDWDSLITFTFWTTSRNVALQFVFASIFWT